MNKPLTLITGADQGMGFEIAKELGQAGHHILLGSRNKDRGITAVNTLQQEGITANLILLDVADETSIIAAQQAITSDFGKLDNLINNAGITLDNWEKPSTLAIEKIRGDFDVNFFGLVSVTQHMLPLLSKSTSSKIINISSAVGSLTVASDPTSSVYKHFSFGYQASKAAVNMFTIDLANELKDTQITVNSVNPGWVATDSDVGGGPKTIKEGVARTVELALQPTNSISGTFSDTDGIVPW